jgi:hypothetical protein
MIYGVIDIIGFFFHKRGVFMEQKMFKRSSMLDGVFSAAIAANVGWMVLFMIRSLHAPPTVSPLSMALIALILFPLFRILTPTLVRPQRDFGLWSFLGKACGYTFGFATMLSCSPLEWIATFVALFIGFAIEEKLAIRHLKKKGYVEEPR